MYKVVLFRFCIELTSFDKTSFEEPDFESRMNQCIEIREIARNQARGLHITIIKYFFIDIILLETSCSRWLYAGRNFHNSIIRLKDKYKIFFGTNILSSPILTIC